jgi:hypothetical protein
VIPTRPPHHPSLRSECIVRIDAHGSPDRVKDASSVCRQRSLAPVIECMRVVAHADDVPLLGYRRTSVVIGAAIPREDTHETRRTDLGLRSDDAPRRAPPSRRPGCLSPPRRAKEFMFAKGLLPPAFAPALSLTPPQPAAYWQGCLCWALQGHSAVARGSVTGSRVQTPL